MRHVIAVFFLFVLGFSSTNAMALFDVQLLAGHRSTTFDRSDDSETIGATELQLSAHVSPFPIVPLGLGVYYINHDYDASKTGEVMAYETLKGSQLGAEAYLWLSLKPTNFSIFAKLGYTFLGSYEGKIDDYSYTDQSTLETANVAYKGAYKTTGTRVGIGAKWSPIALVSFLLEFDYIQDTWEVDSIKISGTSVSTAGAKDIDVSSWSALIGAEVGI